MGYEQLVNNCFQLSDSPHKEKEMYKVDMRKNVIVATKIVNGLEKHPHLNPERVINLSAGSICDRVRYVCAELRFLFAFC